LILPEKPEGEAENWRKKRVGEKKNMDTGVGGTEEKGKFPFGTLAVRRSEERGREKAQKERGLKRESGNNNKKVGDRQRKEV